MLSPSRQFRFHRCPQRAASAGFSLVEIVIALAVLGAMSAGCYIGFNAINTYAVTSRLFSEAQVAAQNQIDLALSRGPFDIVAAKVSGSFDPLLKKIPYELMTTAELDALSPQPLTSPPPTTNQYYPYYRNTAITGSPLAKQAFVYTDPVSGKVIVTGILTMTVVDTVSTMNFVSSKDLNLRRVTVEVAYNFRNRPYSLKMDTLRTADQ
jgi:prepilin-type N-terminal cleavage/methylation domain-containing protein